MWVYQFVYRLSYSYFLFLNGIINTYVRAELLQLCPILCNLWTVACQAPLSIELFRQEYWSGLPFPSPGEPSRPRD